MKSDIRLTLNATELEAYLMKNRSKFSRNKRLLVLFQKDIMIGWNAIGVEAELLKESLKLSPCSWKLQMTAWIVLLSLNAVMLFYLYLFGVGQNIHQQRAWTRSFAMWLAMEIVLISSFLTLISNVWFPMLLMGGVQKYRNALLQTINSVQTTHPPKENFNAAEFFFVSHQVANRFPDLVPSQFILQYQTPWPKKSYGRVTNNKSGFWFAFMSVIPDLFITIVMLMLSMFSNAPQQIQSAMLEIFISGGVGLVVWLHLWLFGVFPVLVVIPSVIVLSIAIFLLRGSNSVKPLVVVPERSKNIDNQVTQVVSRQGIVGRRDSIQAGVVLLQKLEENGSEYHLSDSSNSVDDNANEIVSSLNKHDTESKSSEEDYSSSSSDSIDDQIEEISFDEVL
jgi:hypothetical protein